MKPLDQYLALQRAWLRVSEGILAHRALDDIQEVMDQLWEQLRPEEKHGAAFAGEEFHKALTNDDAAD